jgi:biotin synthase
VYWVSTKLLFYLNLFFKIKKSKAVCSGLMGQSNPKLVRVSLGTATVLGLDLTILREKPTTAYLQTYWDGRCTANCKFCAQSREANAEMFKVARALYPAYPTQKVLEALKKAWINGKIKRVCFQTVNYPGMLKDLKSLVKQVRLISEKIPISTSTHAIPKKELEELKNAGATNMVIPLDACSKRVFDKIKGVKAGGPYRWETHWKALEDALEIFGSWNVGTHLILGLGETEFEAVQIFQKLYEKKIYCGLFAFTPIAGTPLQNLKKLPIESYRLLQLLYYLIFSGELKVDDVKFSREGLIIDFSYEKKKILKLIDSGKPFQTVGCPNCNRPFATESPAEIYNYPGSLRKEEVKLVKKQLAKRISWLR